MGMDRNEKGSSKKTSSMKHKSTRPRSRQPSLPAGPNSRVIGVNSMCHIRRNHKRPRNRFLKLRLSSEPRSRNDPPERRLHVMRIRAIGTRGADFLVVKQSNHTALGFTREGFARVGAKKGLGGTPAHHEVVEAGGKDEFAGHAADGGWLGVVETEFEVFDLVDWKREEDVGGLGEPLS